MPRSHRTRIAKNIYEDAIGLAVLATAAGRTREKRFPAGTPFRTLTRWQEDTRAELRRDAATRKAALPAGSLLESIAHYLGPFTGSVRRDRANLLHHWALALGAPATAKGLTLQALQAAVLTWKAAGVKASTINHRRRALIALLDALAPGAPNLGRFLPREHAPAGQIRALPMPVAEAIVDALPDIGRPVKGHRRDTLDKSKTKARLRVMLWTGLPQATLMRVTPEDVDLERRRLLVRPRRKGQGAAAVELPLLPEAVAALRTFLYLGAWGRFSTKSMAQSFLRAATRARQDHPEIPARCYPYLLRHTFLSYVLEMTGDESAVGVLAQHADKRSTARYVQRGAAIRAEQAITEIGRRRAK